MLWAISCTDKPNTAAARAAVLQPHRDYLKSQKGILVLAGATQTDDGATAIGSLFVSLAAGSTDAGRTAFLVVLAIQGAVGLTGSLLSRHLPQHGRA